MAPKIRLVATFACLVLTSCAASRTRVPPDSPSKVGYEDVFCPTDNERAAELYNEGVNLGELGRVDDAKDYYLRAIDLDPGFCDAMDNLGRLFRTEGNLKKAVYWYDRSLEVFPENPVAHMNLGVAYRMMGKTKEALEEYQTLVRIEPDNPEGYYGLGTVYLDLGQTEDAVTQLEKAEELYSATSSPLITDARHLLGLSYCRLDNCVKAKDYLEEVYSEFEDDPMVNFCLGLCYLFHENENRELAEKYLTRAEELGVEIPREVLQELDR